jgi:hypothetical protein
MMPTSVLNDLCGKGKDHTVDPWFKNTVDFCEKEMKVQVGFKERFRKHCLPQCPQHPFFAAKAEQCKEHPVHEDCQAQNEHYNQMKKTKVAHHEFKNYKQQRRIIDEL